MNFGTFLIAILFVGGPALWVLFDSAKRYQKPSWILALLTPFTFYFSTLLYLAKRFTSKPVEEPAAKPKTWQTAVVAGTSLLICIGTASSPSSNQTASTDAPAAQEANAAASAPKKPTGPVNHYKLALEAAGNGGFTVALRELYLVPPKSPDFAKAQVKIREYKAKEAAVRRAEAEKQRQAQLAEAAADAGRHPEKYLTIVKSSWTKGGFDNICMATLTIKNTSPIAIGDFTVKATFAAESGAESGNSLFNSKTINKVLKPGQTRTFPEVSLGFISDQVESAGFEITDAKAL